MGFTFFLETNKESDKTYKAMVFKALDIKQ